MRFQDLLSIKTSALGKPSPFGLKALGVSLVLITLLSLFLVPLPPAILDLLLVFNIVLALILLLRGIFLQEPTRLFAFPSILLMATLFRLALNVSSTRLILLGGDQSSEAAGQVIEAFGNFVVQGDFIVGAIIFSVIAVVNFVVIARGSARVAEVAARFTLDALPGKQLAIDSELRSGNIDAEEAARRRSTLNQESQFYGAMDGAMKFVQGDAIAGFVITFINAIGGVGLGIKRGMDFSDAVNTFGLLTIGDGLVSIIPSLLVSVCAGVVVTHVSGVGNSKADKNSSGAQVVEQLLGEPQAIGIAGLVMIILGLVTELPILPFLAIGLPAVIWGFMNTGREGSDPRSVSVTNTGASLLGISGGESAQLSLEDKYTDYFSVKPLVLEFADGVDEREIINNYQIEQNRVFQEKGVVLPNLYVRKSGELAGASFRVLINERLMHSGQINPELHYVEVNPRQLTALGLQVEASSSSPLDGKRVSWVRASQDDKAATERLGLSLLSPSAYLAREAIGLALENLEDLFGLSDVSSLVSKLSKRHPKLVEEVLTKEVLTLAEVSELLRRLAREQVSIRSLKRIFEGVLEFRALSNLNEDYDRSAWLDEVHEYIRKLLAHTIISQVVDESDGLRAFLLSEEVESEFRTAVSMWDNYRSRLPLNPEIEASLRNKFNLLFAPVIERGSMPIVLVCGADIRQAVNVFLNSFFKRKQAFLTLSFDELGNVYKPEPVGVIDI